MILAPVAPIIFRMLDYVEILVGYYNGVFYYQGKIFNFIDLKQFMLSSVILLDTKAIEKISERLTNFNSNID
ncbi:hypothetical protein CF386_08710 [Paraphotobacterium marinum]|uniref:Uncharacterized protein n=2 Tax=Paraphotobacterium marinum TaxID=1755811 RepID=A0A220VFV6_9GAMM|nr:hypothetical protein CF386_08710 [Paraphotobacterium marinum]